MRTLTESASARLTLNTERVVVLLLLSSSSFRSVSSSLAIFRDPLSTKFRPQQNPSIFEILDFSYLVPVTDGSTVAKAIGSFT